MLVEVNVDRRGISRKQECWKNLGDDKKPFIIKLKWVVGSEDYDNTPFLFYLIFFSGNKKRNTIIVGVVLAIAFSASIIVTLRYCRRPQTDLTPSMPG